MPNQYNEITTRALPPVTASSSSTADTQKIPLREIRPVGNFSLVVVVSGSGTASIDYLVKNEANDAFIFPTADSSIGTGLTAGTYTFAYSPNITPFIGYRVTETGASNSVTVQITAVIQ